MRLPTIRYPLFWVLGLILAAVAVPVARPPLERAWKRVAEGPPVPSSPRPMIWTGPLPRRALLLRENLEATDRPGGRAVETIGSRLFVAVYDVWPLRGDPTHLRVGTEARAFGWVPATDALAWNSRLVAAGGPVGSSPILDNSQVVTWAEGEAWSRVGSIETIGADGPAADRRAVWMSRAELLGLIRRLVAGESAESVRARAVLGRSSGGGPLATEEIEAARQALPAWAWSGSRAGVDSAAVALARLNESWKAEASWSGLEFAPVPIAILP
jgi:hypothetical protein